MIRYDGQFARVFGDLSRMTPSDVMKQASTEMGSPFEADKHSLICAHTRHNNFKCDAEHLAGMASQNPLASMGVEPFDRILWEQKTTGTETPLSKMQQGALAEIKSMFFVCDVSKDGRISKGEFRNFLWNMNLDDESLDIVWNKINIRKNDELDIDDLLFFLGRSHLLNKEVPIDALLYDGISVMIRGRPGRSQPSAAAFQRWDFDPKIDKQGMGGSRAASATSGRETCSSIWTIAAPIINVLLGGFLLLRVISGVHGQQEEDENSQAGCGLLFFVVIYLMAACFCSKLGSALSNSTEGFDRVFTILDKPRYENPHFRWHIQCYHYETRTRQVRTTDKDGNQSTRTETYQERVNTHFAEASGFIPSTDHTAAYIPDTRATSCEVDTEEQHNFSSSNYMPEFVLWKGFHWRDMHADVSHTERCPSRLDSILATWMPGTKPWWMTQSVYYLVTMLCCHFCYAVKMRSEITLQDYVYHKTCYNIQRPPWGGAWDHMWTGGGGGGLAAGIAIGLAMNS